jgi:formylglycine-generating enzyme required for sulfatase activity
MEAREAKPQKQPEAFADHLATEDSDEEEILSAEPVTATYDGIYVFSQKSEKRHGPYTMMQLQKLVDQGYFSPHDLAIYQGLEQWVTLEHLPDIRFPVVEAPAEPEAEPEPVAKEILAPEEDAPTLTTELVEDVESDQKQAETPGKRNLAGFLFRMAASTFATLLLLLWLCDILNQHMGWNIPIGLGVVGISTTDDAKASKDYQSQDVADRLAGLERQQAEPDVETSGKAFTIPDLSMDMLWVKPGTFEMGSPTTEAGRWEHETRHQVTLTKGFFLGKYEVTQAQWERVMGSNPSKFKGADRPVELVSWNDVTSFGEKLTELERTAGRLPAEMAYQLPTEAQREYACRAGTKTAFYFGDSLTSDQANIKGGPGETTDVGKYPANAWGFHDMHGNVQEWCTDWSGDYPTGAVTDPVGPTVGSDRVLRGGSWGGTADKSRSASRNRSEPANRDIGRLGFRLSLRPASK